MFVEQLIAGGACRSAFAALVAQQFVFYRAMEATLHEHYLADPLVRPLADRKLDRVPALDLDMTHHFGPDYEVGLASGADTLVLAPGQRTRVIDAAVDGFEQNRRIFADLALTRAPAHAAAGAPL